MADRIRPLEDLRKAHENEYFQRKNQELIRKLKERLERQRTVEALKAGTGITDEELLEKVARHGVTPDTVPALHLVPLVQVAWADGEVQPDERELLLDAATNRGLKPGDSAYDFLAGLLDKRPPEELFDSVLEFIAALLAAMPPDEAEAARDNLENLAFSVARATGGLFGRFWNINDDEERALSKIARHLQKTRGKG